MTREAPRPQTSSRWDELLALCEKATPGLWESDGWRIKSADGYYVAEAKPRAQVVANIAFIAACSSATIKELIEENRALAWYHAEAQANFEAEAMKDYYWFTRAEKAEAALAERKEAP